MLWCQAWDENKLCKLIIGRGNGRAFCAGGDVKGMCTHCSGLLYLIHTTPTDVVLCAAVPEKQPDALRFFQKE
jgi:enoyl-CoA hydratase/carnithine racemase